MNLNLIKQRYHSNTLITEQIGGIGYKSKLKLVLMYDELLINRKVLEEAQKKIQSIDNAVIQTAGQ